MIIKRLTNPVTKGSMTAMKNYRNTVNSQISLAKNMMNVTKDGLSLFKRIKIQ